MDCLMKAWSENERFLKHWLQNKTGNLSLAEDLLQEVFLKALKNKERFCSLTHARSWLVTMTRNTAIDHYRTQSHETELLSDPEQPEAPDQPIIFELKQCMNRVMSELNEKDREAIQFCDIDSGSQKAYAEKVGLTLVAAKSRLQRARKKLRSEMVVKCHIEFDETGVSNFTPRK